VFSPGETIQLLIIPDLPTDAISDVSLEIARRDDEEPKRFRKIDSRPVVYNGPIIRFIGAQITAPEKPGAYLITLTGKTHSTTPETSAGFVVQKSADLKRSDRLR